MPDGSNTYNNKIQYKIQCKKTGDKLKKHNKI